ncbi:MAG: hypothetical protein JSS22_17990 [Proteobacteria bacterium]|nr:hypothetical protein [Pseudomonadota bacterium]
MTVSGTTPLTRGKRTAAACAAAALLLSLSLGGCSTSISDMPLAGASSDASQHPKDVSDYPAVHDIPAPREEATMATSEQAKIEQELIAARERQAQASAAALATK